MSPGVTLRRGPRPLLLHLMLASLCPSGLPGGSPVWKPGSPNWNARLAEILASARQGLASPDPAALVARPPDAALVHGIAAYRRHPYRREVAEPPVIWAEGGSRLLDYGMAGGKGVVLFVPSLVNRAHVLDLMAGHSLLRFLAGQGLRPVLLDWGWPGAEERRFDLTDYIAGRLERALAFLAPERPALAGYCMGGNLALAAAVRGKSDLRGLALLATPWDFHAGDPGQGAALAAALPGLESLMGLDGALPVDALQMLFTLLDPVGVWQKYRQFGTMEQGSDRARLFVALEDWLNDGVPLAAPVARACFRNWYGENQPARGVWRVGGEVMRPETLRLPVFLAVPGRDRIVPPESARALAAVIPGATVLAPAAGHVGMVAGGGAERALWRPLAAWLGQLPAPRRRRRVR